MEIGHRTARASRASTSRRTTASACTRRRAICRRSSSTKRGLLLPFTTYFQDPFVAKTDPKQAFDEKVFVAWEPGLTDGPTSSRFAVVDYNADTGTLEPPAVWDEDAQAFVEP